MRSARDRLIFALDVATAADARQWIDRLGDSVTFYKLGMELLTSGDYFRVLEDLAGRGKSVFVDLKFHDVPATVAATIRGLRRYPVSLCTIHAQHDAMMRAAADEKGDIRLLGVTVLTSMDRSDLQALRIDADPADIVVERARLAQAAGLDGVIASGQEAAALRAATGAGFLIVCPGIRPAGPLPGVLPSAALGHPAHRPLPGVLPSAALGHPAHRPSGDDQKRTVDVPTAFRAGADAIVVGRPIRQAADPAAAAEAIHAQIVAALGDRAPSNKA